MPVAGQKGSEIQSVSEPLSSNLINGTTLIDVSLICSATHEMTESRG